MDFEKCSNISCDQIILVKENKSSFRINNKSKYKVSTVTVDGCLIDDARTRCDYLFEIGIPVISVRYVELKGSDIEKAYKQLGATVGYCREHYAKLPSLSQSCYIVASRVPRSGPKTQELKKKFAKAFDIQLIIKTNSCEITV